MTTPPKGAAPRPAADRFRIYVAIGIVLVSIGGALVSFAASKSSENAAGLAQQAVQERQLQEQGHTFSRFLVSVDLDRAGTLLERLRQAGLLAQQARRSGSPSLRAGLRADAERTDLEANTLRRYLLDRTALDEKTSSYNQKIALRDFEQANTSLNALRPGETRSAANDARHKTVRLVGAAAGLAIALFTLTLAQLTRRPRRRAFAGIGAGVGIASAVAALVIVAS